MRHIRNFNIINQSFLNCWYYSNAVYLWQNQYYVRFNNSKTPAEENFNTVKILFAFQAHPQIFDLRFRGLLLKCAFVGTKQTKRFTFFEKYYIII